MSENGFTPSDLARITEGPLPPSLRTGELTGSPLFFHEAGALAEAVSTITGRVGSVAKNGYNKFQSYYYATMDDIRAALAPHLKELGIMVIQNEDARDWMDGGAAIAVRYAFWLVHKSGAQAGPVYATGLSRCRDSKGGFDDKSINKCRTAAAKYFLRDTFQIATGDEDADQEDTAAPHKSAYQILAEANYPSQAEPVQQPAHKPYPLNPQVGPLEQAMNEEPTQEGPEVKTVPRALPTNRGMAAFAAAYKIALDGCLTAQEIWAWSDKNQEALAKIKGNPKAGQLYESLVSYTKQRHHVLGGGVAEKSSS